MTKLAKIERDIATLSPFELVRLRVWFEHRNADAFDRRIKRDAATGRLDALADAVLADHHAGKTRSLSLTSRRWLPAIQEGAPADRAPFGRLQLRISRMIGRTSDDSCPFPHQRIQNRPYDNARDECRRECISSERTDGLDASDN